jgi:hypothetical protein
MLPHHLRRELRIDQILSLALVLIMMFGGGYIALAVLA